MEHVRRSGQRRLCHVITTALVLSAASSCGKGKVGDLTDANGRHFVREMLDIARRKGEGEVEYAWRNPMNQKVEKKRAYIVRVNRYLVGAGAYFGPAR